MLDKLKKKYDHFMNEDDITTFKGFVATVIREYFAENQHATVFVVTFYLMLLVYPIILIGAFIIGNIPLEAFQDIEGLKDVISNQLINDLIGEAQTLTTKGINISLIVTLVLVSSSAFKNIIDFGTKVYRTNRKRSYFVNYGLSVILILIISLITIIYNLYNFVLYIVNNLITTVINQEVIEKIQSLTFVHDILNYTSYIYVAVVFTIFLIIYKIVPNKLVPTRTILPGTFISSFFLIFGVQLLGEYISVYSYYSKIYGNYLSFISLIIGLYFLSEVILISIRINSLFYRKHLIKEQNEK